MRYRTFATWSAACAAIGAGAWLILGYGLVASPVAQEALGPPLQEPQMVLANNGVTSLTLDAAPRAITVLDRAFTSNVYNGQYIPPVFRLRRGDELQLRLINRIGPADVQIDETQATNLHYHGMSVSPRPPADDIYLVIPSLQMIQNPSLVHNHTGMEMRDNYVFDYRWRVPEDHDQGPFWYHSHAHGQAEGQVLSGLSGMFMIDGFINDWYPTLNGARERILILKDIQLPGSDDDAPKSKTINGQRNPTITMTRSQPQIWQIGNVGADAFFDLEVEGLEFWVLARDGNPLSIPYSDTRLWLPPGARLTVFITSQRVGQFRLISRAINTGPQGDPNPEVRLGTVVVEAPGPMAPPDGPRDPGIPLPTRRGEKSAAAMLRDQRIVRSRVITFSESADGNSFFINGQQWSPDRDDAVTQIGDVEEWTVRNVTGEHHVFHIHQTDFLVTESNGERLDIGKMMDTINVPFARNGRPGEVKLIMPFLEDRIAGRFVYHCHILEHEDGGMMANINVQPRR
ncbi:MAG: multicopper oxidase family protein [Vicinamibacterales bacterium]